MKFVLFSVFCLLSSVFCLLSSVLCPLTYANNIVVSNVSLQNIDATAGTVDIKFDLICENSYTSIDENSQAFFDRAWVFVKFWKTDWATNGTVPWKHATLVSGGTVSTYNAATGVGVTSDGKGVFCKPGFNQTIKWNFAAVADGVTFVDTVQVKVMAIEMVYIPQGSFYAGDGSTGTTARFKQGDIESAYNVTSEAAITVGTASGNLYYGATGGNYGDGLGPIPAAFPKGYNAFYIMKYEISQGQYCDFLNTLTTTQASARIDSGGHFNTYRNFIKKSDDTVPLYGCDANDNAGVWGSATYSLMNEADDGQNVACNYLSWAELCAYADWAGLRPMTELEFEKACRGGSPTNNVLAGELAWGSTSITQVTSISNSGANNEAAGQTGDGLCAYAGAAGVQGPLRCGFAATASTTTRSQAGASYYGVMDLSGNLWERAVTIGNATGRVFTGLHGDGVLGGTGNANVINWPGTDAVGAGYRGGSWYDGATDARASDRYYAASTDSSRSSVCGGRCVRTSP